MSPIITSKNLKRNLNINNISPIAVYWSGKTLLIESVMEILAKTYESLIRIENINQKYSNEHRFLVHDGEVKDKLKTQFDLDFDINHYGQCPYQIAENLSLKFFSGLV